MLLLYNKRGIVIKSKEKRDKLIKDIPIKHIN